MSKSTARHNPTSRRCSASAFMTLALLIGTGTSATAEMKVVVSSKPAHALVASVMGSTGTPTVLVAGAASPHTYALKPSDARAANAATVLFRIGEGLEPFTAKLTASLPKSVRVVSLQDAPGVTSLPRRETGAFAAADHSGHSHGHSHGGKSKSAAAKPEDERDPHVWLDPRNASAMVDHIAAVLAELEPANATAFRTNADATKARIARLADELERDLKPVAGRPFVVLHDAYQYLEARFGLTAVGSIAVNPEAAPSGKKLSAIRKRIADANALCVFAEPGMQPKVIAVVVESTKAKTALLDPEATQLAPGPTVYEDLMRGLATSIKSCLGAA